MSQWGPPQGQGYQYPMQTGFPAGNNPAFNPQMQQQQQPQFQQQQQQPQFQQQQQPQQTGFGQNQNFNAGMGGLMPQRTGFPGQGMMQAQPTGFPSMQAQPTGFAGNFQQQQNRAPPPVPSLPTQYQQQQNQQPSFLNAPPPVPNRFGSPGLVPQQTGFPGQGGPARPLMPQMTGFVDPRLQMMSSTFMPTNTSAPYNAGGAPMLPSSQLSGGLNLQQSFQQHNEDQRGTAAPKVPWALSKSEKKSYDNIFRAWDAKGTGFIDGQTALSVFGQSGLSKDDLARVWTLADVDDRGKLNMAEFHVAMGLIYRKLNGNEIPDVLPPELVPPSARDLDSSVNFLKDVLKNETRSRSPSNMDSPVSYGKVRSFNSNDAPREPGRDATIYKHQDAEPPGGFYQSKFRSVDRDRVRARGDNSPTADLDDVKNMLKDTAKLLDNASERNDQDAALDEELEDLKFRIKRLQDDLAYVSRGSRTTAKDQERRHIERELTEIMHVKVPDVERKIKDREARRDREKRQWARERDRTNERSGRYQDRDYDRDRDRYTETRYDDRDRDYRPYSRGPEPDSRDDRSYQQGSPSGDRTYESARPSSPPAIREPPPPPPSAPPANNINNPPSAPKPPSSPAPNMKNMTAQERQAYARAEAQRRIEARKAALGIVAAPSPGLDTSVEDRLQQEKKEAEAKALAAEKEAEERDRMRKERLDRERGVKAEPETPTSAPATPASLAPAKKAPPPVKARAPAPPPPRRGAAPPPPPAIVTKTPPAPAPAPAADSDSDSEDEAIRARQEELRKKKEARAERLRQLEREEEEARLEEEREKAASQARKNIPVSPAAPPSAPSPSIESIDSTPAASIQSIDSTPAPTPPPPPPAPPAPPPPASEKSTNPFSRLIKEGGGVPTPSASSPSSNPWASSASSTPPAVSTPPVASPTPPARFAASPGPPPMKSVYNTAPSSGLDDDWEDIKDLDDDGDSSDDDLATAKSIRSAMAEKLFGSRPDSAGPSSSPASPAPRAPAAPPAPAPPPAPAAPPPPAAPPAPRAPGPAASGGGPGDVSALMASIQGGARLRSVKTVDKSGPPVSGKVLGDNAPPEHINAAPRPASPTLVTSPEPTPMDQTSSSQSSHRQSVDWYAGLAADAGSPPTTERLPSTMEVEEEEAESEQASPLPVPEIQVNEPANDALADIDMTTEYRARTLYAFEGEGPDDISFKENLVILAHPSKSGGDWWYGTLPSSGKKGMFPQTYVQRYTPSKAKALYTYSGGNPDELSFAEGDIVDVVDKMDSEWWQTEQAGMIFIAPAAYLESLQEEEKAPTPVSNSPAHVISEGYPVTDHDEHRPGEIPHAGSDTDSDSDSTDDAYLSFDSDQEDGEQEQDLAERKAREHERQLVLEAAGLILKQDKNSVPPPRPPLRSRSKRARRPPPAAPEHKRSDSQKDLPSVPEGDTLSLANERLDDAFERYEAFKREQGDSEVSKRLSVVSNLSGDWATPPSPTVSSMSREESSQGSRYTSLMQFLGRSKTPTSHDEKPKLVISAPILATPTASNEANSPARMNSPAFGTSWASLVDKSVADEIPDRERKRQEAIFEFIATEIAYVRDLQLIVEIFYSSMVSMLDHKEVTVVFANIEDILITNTTFMSSLEERQKECRLFIDRIGDILQSHMSHMALYLEYCANQGTAAKVLQSLRDSKPELASHLQQLREENAQVRNLDLSSYLLVPIRYVNTEDHGRVLNWNKVQRITRYPLLVKQIMHYTDKDSEEYKQMHKALTIAERILDHINESIRDQEGREVLRVISQHLWIGQGRLDLTAPTRYMGERKLYKEGLLMKAKSGRRLRAFLCSDILVLTDENQRNLYRMPMSLSEAQVKDLPSGRDDTGFQIYLPYPRGGDSISLKATSVRDCQLWMKAIETAIQRCRAAERRRA